MISPEFSTARKLELTALGRVDAICDRFESEWIPDHLNFEGYCSELPSEYRGKLLEELVAIDFQKRAEQTTDRWLKDDYLRHLPNDSDAVVRAFQRIVQAGISVSATDALVSEDEQTLPPGESASVLMSETITFREGDTPRLAPFRRGRPFEVNEIGDYELVQEIARGGMGVVYRARQKGLNREVALKMILSGQLAGKEEVSRFRSEAEAAARLDHPGIVPVYEVGQIDGQPFFSMGFIEGESLAKKLADGPLEPKEAARFLDKISAAVEYAHKRGIVHRDLKPGNVLVTVEGEPKITDFGLAKRLDGDSELTATGQVLGTPSYMPPEQAAGKLAQVNERSDVYALGAILYCMLVGRPPFQSGNQLDTLMQVLDKDPVAPRELDSKIPKDLETICLKCLSKDPDKRYESADGLSDDLNRFLSGKEVLARPVSRVETAWRWCKRNPDFAKLLSATLIVFVSAFLWTANLAMLTSQAQESAADDSSAATQQRAAASVAKHDNEIILSFVNTNILGAARRHGVDVTLRDALLDADKEFDRTFKSDSLVAADVRYTLGESFRIMGEYDKAISHLERCSNVRAAKLGEKDGYTVQAQLELLRAYRFAGRLDDAAHVLQSIAAKNLYWWTTYVNAESGILAQALIKNGERDQAEVLLRSVLPSIESLPEDRWGWGRHSMWEASRALVLLGSQDEAVALMERLFKRHRSSHGDDQSETLIVQRIFGQTLELVGRTVDAVSVFEATLAGQNALLGADHRETLLTAGMLASALNKLGRREEELRVRESHFPADRATKDLRNMLSNSEH